MDRLHLQRRPLAGLLLVLLTLASSATACSDELVEIPEELRGEPACAWVIDSYVHFDGDAIHLIYDQQTEYTGAACLCVTEEEYESRSRDEEFNALALDICNKLAAQHDFVWNECQMDYESERWLDMFYWAQWIEHPSAEALGARGAMPRATSLGLFAEGSVAETCSTPGTAAFRRLALDENSGARRHDALHHGLLGCAGE